MIRRLFVLVLFCGRRPFIGTPDMSSPLRILILYAAPSPCTVAVDVFVVVYTDALAVVIVTVIAAIPETVLCLFFVLER